MSNLYYNAPDAPVDFTKASATVIRQQLAAIEQAFDKLPTPEELLEGVTGPMGPMGPQGPAGGPVGPQGLSAYQVALEEGYVGTVTQWLASLKGAKGDKGDKGDTGNTGAQGPQGPKGDKGDTGAGSDWNSLANKPELLTALAAATPAAGEILVKTADGIDGLGITALISAMTDEARQDFLDALNAPRIVSMSIAATGYIEFALPDDGGSIMLEWGSYNAPPGISTVSYPKAGTSWSVAVASSSAGSGAQVNAPGTSSSAAASFKISNSRDDTKATFWIAVVR